MESAQIQFRTLHKNLNATVGIVTGICIFIFLHSIFTPNTPVFYNPKDLLAAGIAVVVSFYFAFAISGADTTLSFNGYDLVFDSQSNFGIFHTKTISREEIKAYEIHESKYWQRLVFYRRDQKPIMITLKRLSNSEKQQLTSFFESHQISSIKTLKTLSGGLFKETLLRSFIIIFSGFLVFLILYIAAIAGFYETSRRLPEFNTLNISVTLVIIIVALYFPIQKLYSTYRIHAQITWFLLGLAMVITAILISDNFEVLSQKPVRIGGINKTTIYPYEKYFIINEVLCDTTLTGYYKTFSSGRRSATFSVSHYIISPVNNSLANQTGQHAFWLGDNYSQKIRKSSPPAEQNGARIWFMNQKVHEFNLSVNKPHSFFEVMYSDLNPRARAKNYFFAAHITGRIQRPLIILRPHEESFEAFRKNKMNQVYMLAGFALLLLMGNAIVIAVYR